MIFKPLGLYKVVEIDHAIGIIDHGDRLPIGPNNRELMIGQYTDVAVFLSRYIPARERGMTIEQAQAEGIRGAEVTAYHGGEIIRRIPGVVG